MSENTTSPPQYLTQFAEAAKVIGVVMILSPAEIPNANTDKCNAAVPLATATA